MFFQETAVEKPLEKKRETRRERMEENKKEFDDVIFEGIQGVVFERSNSSIKDAPTEEGY